MDGIRFTSIDPMAGKYYSWSPYVYCANNPMKYIDPTGMDIYFFDGETGEYPKEKYENKDVHRIAIKNTDKNGNITIQFYDLADPVNDSQDIENGEITNVEVLSSKDVEGIIEGQGGFNNFNGDALIFGVKSSGNGAFDYSMGGGMTKYMKNKGKESKLNKSLYVAKGDTYAHNKMNFGNFLWGATGYSLKYSENILLKAANFNSIYNPGRRNGYVGEPDSADDQLSITRGVKYAQKNNYRNKTYWFKR